MNTLSGVLFFVAFMPYIWAITSHQTVPSPVSWAIWACVDTLALVAMKKEGGSSLGQITGATIGAWSIVTLALFYGKPSMGSVEWVSIAGAVTGIILWQKTGNARLAIICSQIAIFIGAIPTFVNAYHAPTNEDPTAWTIWFCSCVCALLAVKKWDLTNALQPVTFMVIETVMVILVVILPHLFTTEVGYALVSVGSVMYLISMIVLRDWRLPDERQIEIVKRVVGVGMMLMAGLGLVFALA
jgi:hypothetical protein